MIAGGFANACRRLLLRHGRVYPGGNAWTKRHRARLAAQRFDHEAFAPATHRLAAYRGIACWGALTLTSEIIEWRRFANARACMGFTGLVASEYSSGDRVARGHITNAGPAAVRTALVEAAWHYRHRPAAGAALTRRQARVGPDTVTRSWAAQQRLCGRFARMTARGKHPNQAVVAVARELAGFLWAEMTT